MQPYVYIRNQKIEYKVVNIFLSISLNICFGCSKEPSHYKDGSFEYPQHMFWLRIKYFSFTLCFNFIKRTGVAMFNIS